MPRSRVRVLGVMCGSQWPPHQSIQCACTLLTLCKQCVPAYLCPHGPSSNRRPTLSLVRAYVLVLTCVGSSPSLRVSIAALSETILPAHTNARQSTVSTSPFTPAPVLDGSVPVCEELSPHALQLVAVILPLLPGRVWDGKHLLLQALADVAVYCRSQFIAEGPCDAESLASTSTVSTLAPQDIRRVLIALARIVGKPVADPTAGGDSSIDPTATLLWKLSAVQALGRVASCYASTLNGYTIVSAAVDVLFASLKVPLAVSAVPAVIAAAASEPGCDAPSSAVEPPTKRSAGMVGMRVNTEAEAESRASEKVLESKRAELLFAAVACVGLSWPSACASFTLLRPSEGESLSLCSHTVTSLLEWTHTAAWEGKSVAFAALER